MTRTLLDALAIALLCAGALAIGYALAGWKRR
jgi:hypothetical protein